MLINGAHQRMRSGIGGWIRISQLDCIEAGLASPFGVVNGTGSLDLLTTRRIWVWSGYIPSDTGIHPPGISLNPLITVTGEVVVPVLSSAEEQGGPQRIVATAAGWR